MHPRWLIPMAVVVSVNAAAAEPSPSDKETARALFKEGEQKRKAGDLPGALEAFRAAHAIMNVPTTGLELGKVQAQLGQIVEARDTLLSVVRIPVVPGEPEKYPLARDEAKKLAESLEPKLASLKIVVTKVPGGATPKISVDGAEIHAATVGLTRKHNPGKHEIVVAVGKVEKKESVDLAEGETKEVTFDFSETDAPPAAPPKDVHDDPPPLKEPPKEPPPRTMGPLFWGGYGAAAVFLVGGSVAGILALSNASTAKEGCVEGKCPPATHDALDSSRTWGTVATVGFVLGGVGLLVGTIGLFQSKEPEPAPVTSLRLNVGPGAVALTGTF